MTLFERMDALRDAGLKHVNCSAARFIEQMGKPYVPKGAGL